MANIFQRSWDDLGNWLGSTEGQMLQMEPTGQVTGEPTGDFGIPQKMTPTGQVTGNAPGQPPVAYRRGLPVYTSTPATPQVVYRGMPTQNWPTMQPTGQVTGNAPSHPAQPPVMSFSGQTVRPYQAPTDVNLNAAGTVWNYLNVPRTGAGVTNASTGVGVTQPQPTPNNVAGINTYEGPYAQPQQQTVAQNRQSPVSSPTSPSLGQTNQPTTQQPTAQQPAAGPADWRGYQTGATDESGQPVPATPAQPVAIDHTVKHMDGSTTKISHKSAAAQPQQAGQQGQGQPQPQQPGGQPEVRRAYPVGVTPRAQPVQQGWAQNQPQQPGQNVNLQVPAHPGLLQRIGQTIGHFFSGTLGQWAPQQGQQQAQPAQPGAGSSALTGVHRALQSGRQHVARHGPAPPASQAAPAAPFPYQTTPELNTWETGTEMPGIPSRVGVPSDQTNVFPYVDNPDLLRAGGTLPPRNQFTLSSGY
jgi:hypothetical protein